MPLTLIEDTSYPTKVSPDEQAARDQQRLALLDLEKNDPSYGGTAQDQSIVENQVSKVASGGTQPAIKIKAKGWFLTPVEDTSSKVGTLVPVNEDNGYFSSLQKLNEKSVEEIPNDISMALAHGESKGEVVGNYITGIIHGLTAGGVTWASSIGERAFRLAMSKAGVSDKEWNPNDQPFTQAVSNFMENVGNPAVVNSPAFKAGQKAIGTSLGGNAISALGESGHPILQLGAEALLAGQGVREAYKGFKETPEQPKPTVGPDIPVVDNVINRNFVKKEPNTAEPYTPDLFPNEPGAGGLGKTTPYGDLTQPMKMDENGIPVRELPPDQGTAVEGQADLFRPKTTQELMAEAESKPGFLRDAIDKLRIAAGEKERASPFGGVGGQQGGAIDLFLGRKKSIEVNSDYIPEGNLDSFPFFKGAVEKIQAIWPRFSTLAKDIVVVDFDRLKAYSDEVSKENKDFVLGMRDRGQLTEALKNIDDLYPDIVKLKKEKNEIYQSIKNDPKSKAYYDHETNGVVVNSGEWGKLWKPEYSKDPAAIKTVSNNFAGLLAHELTHALQQRANPKEFLHPHLGGKYDMSLEWGKRPQEIAAEKARYTAQMKASPNYGKFGQGGAIMIHKRVKTTREMTESDITRILSKVLSRSDSLKELEQQIKSQNIPTDLKTKLLLNAETMFNGKGDFLANHPNEASSSVQETVYSRNNQTMQEAINSLPRKEDGSGIKPIQDIDRSGIGLMTQSWATKTKLLSKTYPEAARILKNVWDEGANIGEIGHRLNTEIMPYIKDYKKMTSEFMNTKTNRLAVVKAFGIMEKKASEWFDGQNYYPTKQQVIDIAGLTDKQAEAYGHLTKVMNKMFDVVDMTQALLGRKALDRIPGYVPHIWKGAYSFFVEGKDPTTGQWKVVGKYNFPNAYQAQRAIDSYKKSFDENARIAKDPTGEEIIRPHTQKESVSSYIADIRETLNIIENTKGQFQLLKAVLDKVESSTTESIIKQSMERKLNLAGHEVDRMLEGMPYDAHLLMDMHHKIYKNAVQFYETASFAKRVMEPFHNSELNQMPNLRKAVNYIGDNFVGKLKNIELDQMLRTNLEYWLSKGGLNPHISSLVGSLGTNLFSRWALLLNPGFYLANSVQMLNSAMVPMRARAIGLANGERVGNLAVAYASVIKDLPMLLADKHELNRIATNMGKTDPLLSEHLSPGAEKWQDPIAKGTEHMGRSVSFAMGYHYFKQIMPKDKAYEAAAQAADDAMVNYDRSMGRPPILNQVDKDLSIFMTYVMHDLGQFYHDVKLAAVNPKQASAYLPLISYQLMKYSLFGSMGLTFMSNLDDIIRHMNDWFNQDWPTMKDRVRMLGDKYNWSDGTKSMSEFGAVSQVAGVDVSSSGQGANIQAGVTGLVDMLGTIGKVAKNAAQAALSNALKDTPYAGEVLPVSTDKWADAFKGAPGVASWYLEQALKSKDIGDWLDRSYKGLSGDMKSDYGYKSGTIIPQYERSTEDTLKKAWVGRNSLQESEAKTTYSVAKAHEANLTRDEKNSINLLIDDVRFSGKLSKNQSAAIYSQLGSELGLTEEQIHSAIKGGIEEQALPYEIAMAKKAGEGDARSGLIYIRLLQQMKREPIPRGK